MGSLAGRKSLVGEHFDTPLPAASLRTTDAPSSTSERSRSPDEVRVFEKYQHVSPDLSGESQHPPSPHTEIRRTESQIQPTKVVCLNSSHATIPVRTWSTMYRLSAAVMLFVAVVPFLHSTYASSLLQPVSGSTVPIRDSKLVTLQPRADSPANVCFRWAQQSSINNGSLFLYGGQAITDPSQTQNKWNNDFLTLDLTTSWQISTPALTGLPQPSGPPNVSLGYLWSSHKSLWLYGGQFDWMPPQDPTAFSLWEYAIADPQWIEHSDPVTSQGVSAPSDGEPVQRAAEGAGVNVPSLGRGFYFGGHLDGYTTKDWSQSVPRVYLQSLLEFTFPGHSNTQVGSLSNNQNAGSSGVYRNITEGGSQSLPGFTQRADGLLVYVPGFGDEGILLALAGGTNDTFTAMNVINVYDIAKSTWYTQATSGSYPKTRVSPCSVIAAAPDGSSYNVYMFGGQNLNNADPGNQTQYSDMWILTLPSFTWIEVDTSGQSVPYGRSGHTCNVWNGQMIVVGGYLGQDQSLTCESPGIYVFDMSANEWVNQFTAKSPGSDGSSDSTGHDGSGSTGSNNPFNQQPAQRYSANSAGGLEGSYGYTVPQAVIDVIGGDSSGSATLTTAVMTATAGPIATGRPVTYTITNGDGSTTTTTSAPGANSGHSSSGAKIGAIVAGVLAGILGVIAGYLAFCTYVYRKQLKLYKRHVEMSQAQARGEKMSAMPGLLATNASLHRSTPSGASSAPGDGSTARPWPTRTSEGSSCHTRLESSGGSSGQYPSGYNLVRRNSETSEAEDLIAGHEPSFVGVMLNPRRSLRVINRD